MSGEIRRFKRYPSYKDSGVEWLGEIPSHWDAMKVKRLCLVKRGASPRPIEDPIYFDDDGDYAWVRIADVSASERYLETTTQRLSLLGKAKSVALEPGELFLSIAATVGKPIITKIKCCIHDGFVYFVGLRENREFLYYILSGGEPYKGLGKLGTQLNLNTDTIGDIYLPLAPAKEQERVVRFLDRETARIDAMVAKKERLIELLQEKRSALITHAVTKGLDPNVLIRDSGVEWLGEIPTQWEAGSLGRWWDVIDCKHRTVQFVDEGIPVASIGEVKGDHIDLSTANRTSEIEYLLMIDDGRDPRVGDIVYSRNATVGAAALVVGTERFCLGQDVSLIRSSRQNGRFLMLLLKTPAVLGQLQSAIVGTTFNRINVARIRSFLVCVPPVDEQERIAAFCMKASEESDRLIDRVSDAVRKLRELRTALISAAVTGKIDVREEVE